MHPPRLRCPVRACGVPLLEVEGGLACGRGHRFDRARQGYVHLLQPDERRSREPGDSAEIVAARLRLAEAGVDAALVRAVCERVRQAGLGPRAALLEVGCGIGTQLAALAEVTLAERFGLDLSRPALKLAARAARGARCLLANADRGLPFLDHSLELVLSVKARCNAGEFARVLGPGATLLVAVPGLDDLAELRSATAGAALARDPAERVLTLLEADFELLERQATREQVHLAAAALADLARVGYRGARASERARLAELQRLDVTLSATLLAFRRRTT